VPAYLARLWRVAVREAETVWPRASPGITDTAEAPRVRGGAEAVKVGGGLHSRSAAHSQDRTYSRGVPGSQFRGRWATS